MDWKPQPMKVLVITSCTGEKAVHSEQQLTLADFRQGAAHVEARSAELAELLLPAEVLYTGQQHQRLMRGVAAFRSAAVASGGQLDLRILSAGYGLVRGDMPLAPYEATFQGMKAAALKSWAQALGVPQAIRQTLEEDYDLALVLLGEDYLKACELDAQVKLGGPTLLMGGAASLKRLPALSGIKCLALSNGDASRFGCALIALKGELGSRVLVRLSADPNFARSIWEAEDLKSLLEGGAKPVFKRQPARVNARVDQVIQIPESWRNKPHRSQIRYFIPEWDDLVDPDYDFDNDIHSSGGGDWSNEVYAHQMYPEPNYDGILISKVVAEKSKKKKERINAMGVHRFLRVPRDFPIMGDCGAFGYIGEKNPPYSTPEIIDYYSRLDFDLGVSIDHLCVASNEDEWKHRYGLTIDNAADFIREHRRQKLAWTPIGAVQGWDPKSYADAAAQMVKMGYSYLGLGGLVRSPTTEIVEIMKAVRQQVPREVQVHCFGLARLGGLRILDSLGVSSVDSASFLRRAWMGTGQNYLTDNGEFVAAIRIPEGGKSFRAKRMVSEGRASAREVARMEAACLKAMADFDAGRLSVVKTCDIIEEYDQLITPDRASTRLLLEKTLHDAPWKRCPCAICRKDGIQVIIFRGNNRNRRRGFHNTWLFYQMFQDVLAGKDIIVPGRKHLFELLDETRQVSLFGDTGLD